MSDDDQADHPEETRDEEGSTSPKPGSRRRGIRLEDIKAAVRKETKTAAKAEGMSLERYEEVEKAIKEGRDDAYTSEERDVVERIQESLRAQSLAQIQGMISKPWFKTYAATDLLQSAFGQPANSIIQNLSNVLAPLDYWGNRQSVFAANLPKSLATGVTHFPETLSAFRNPTVHNQTFLDSMPTLLSTITQWQETVQSAARAALSPGFATTTQEFLTSDHNLRYRRNHPVWHYTNGHALLSILRNGELWASSPDNLNDSSELTHGFEIIRQAFKDQAGEGGQPEGEPADWETVLSDVLNEDDVRNIINEVYLISASAERDSLTLWRNYADGDGFALGIDASIELSADGLDVDDSDTGETIRKGIPPISGWYRVSYKERDKQKLAYEFIQSAMEDISRTPEESRPKLVLELRKQAVILASVMKHKAFEDEKEVRWITTNFTTFDPVHYEHGRSSIVPVLHIRASEEEETSLPLKGLRCSPIPDRSIVRTMQGLLRQQKYERASHNVEQSQQPFKG